MLETLTNIKNNKIKQQQANVGDKEMVLKMKKFLSGLAKKRSVHSTEALRVSLDDIHNIETKGKWWLIGSSWKDNLVGTESKYASKEVAEDLKKDASLQQALLKLARQQGMNTDIRRSIFVVLMSSEVLFYYFFCVPAWIFPLSLCMDAHCLGTCKIGLCGCL
jgi:nucleolar MIF4G domain-containing protein 1